MPSPPQESSGTAPTAADVATRGSLRGLRRAVKLVLQELETLVRHRWALLTWTGARTTFLTDTRPLRLNLGCGAKVKQGWLNVDLHPAADLRIDLRERLPLPSACADLVYTEHFLEHLDRPGDAESFLLECLRVLRPGGRISVGVPDTAWPLREYAEGGEWYRLARERWHPPTCGTPLDHVNFHFRQNGAHRYAYDAATLADLLSRVGFVSPAPRDFDPDLDSEDRQPGTLYVDAVRPGADATASPPP